jgi:hypothetical protein
LLAKKDLQTLEFKPGVRDIEKRTAWSKVFPLETLEFDVIFNLPDMLGKFPSSY